MCGRFTLTLDPDELKDFMAGLEIPSDIRPYLQPRYNIAPTNKVAVIANTGDLRLDLYRWGLIPSWASVTKADPSNSSGGLKISGETTIPDIGNRLINARADTLDQKPSFRTAYRKQRCLILADGFYEWWFDEKENRKVPMYFYLKETDPEKNRTRKPFAFAGLWDRWVRHEDNTEIRTCTIITTTPSDVVASVHGRMPVILPPEAYGEWLSPADRRIIGAEDPLLVPYQASDLVKHPVSRRVNSPDIDDPQCVEQYQN